MQNLTVTNTTTNLSKHTTVRNFLPYGTLFEKRHAIKLQENHKEMAVKCFAEYMQRSDVADTCVSNGTSTTKNVNYI